jgi:hypothetical protein
MSAEVAEELALELGCTEVAEALECTEAVVNFENCLFAFVG